MLLKCRAVLTPTCIVAMCKFYLNCFKGFIEFFWCSTGGNMKLHNNTRSVRLQDETQNTPLILNWSVMTRLRWWCDVCYLWFSIVLFFNLQVFFIIQQVLLSNLCYAFSVFHFHPYFYLTFTINNIPYPSANIPKLKIVGWVWVRHNFIL